MTKIARMLELHKAINLLLLRRHILCLHHPGQDIVLMAVPPFLHQQSSVDLIYNLAFRTYFIMFMTRASHLIKIDEQFTVKFADKAKTLDNHDNNINQMAHQEKQRQ